ncbi:MAG: TonB-dependent receptor [Gemmatimonadaceae bacterium]|nr:TonB-dependent receptor [Gemmatimonadaceae bacterium]
MHTPSLKYLAWCMSVLLCWPQQSSAQVGTTTEIIAGRVTGPDSQPIAGARLEITSASTGVKRLTTTRGDGRFTLLFRDGGSQFSVTVTAIGMRPATFVLARRGDEDRLVADIQMSATPTTLAQVNVRARAARPGAAPSSTAGATEAVVPQGFLVRFPLTPGDLNSAATLVPGVTTIAGGDSASGGISVGGQPANQNNITLDGGSFLFGSVPQNSIRAVRVVTNAYDPARGQFSGGQIATTTIGGGSRTQGNATFNAQPRVGQFPTVAARSFDQRFTQGTAGLGIGGPLVKDRAFYFLSFDLDRREEVLASLLDVTPRIGRNLGIAPDSLARFLAFAERNGLNSRTGVPDARLTSSLSSLVRVDWDVTPTSALLVRGDYRLTDVNATRFSPLALPSLGGENRSTGGGLFASLTSSLGAFINEFRAYASQDEQRLHTEHGMPLGVVTVVSSLDSGRTGQSQLQFGSNPSLPRAMQTRLAEVSNELSWLVSGSHRFKLGALMNAQRSRVLGVGNQRGTFVYNSLADLEAGQPALYARVLNGTDQRAGTTTGGLYLADAWRVTPSLQVVYGGRAEATWLSGVPKHNPAVAQAFGVNTNDWPSDVRFTPRVGFTYLLGNVAGIPAGTIKGGVGAFRGTIPTGLISAVANGTGLPGAQQQVVCTGAAVPVPDWSAFAADVSAPESCQAGLGTSSISSVRPTVLLLGRDAGAPEVWRASLGYSRQFRLKWAVASDVVYSHGRRSPLAIDRNLGASGFTLSTESGRPVYAQPGAIAQATGAATGDGTRPQGAFGPTLLIGSSAQSRSMQVTATVAGPGVRGGGGTSVSYTFNRMRDMSNGFGLGTAIPTTAGDPNVVEWAASDLERRHQIVAQEFASFPHGLELAVIGRIYSGTRYTPMINGDANADGQRNDRAFIPTVTGGAMAEDMRTLLAATDRRAESCLRAQMGRIAARNSCTTGWTPQMDVQINWKPRGDRLDDRLTISLVASNTLAGLDRALHGNNIKGWGQPLMPDRNLLTTTGFDAATRQYRYAVNQRFGTPTGARNPLGVPFQLALRARMALGTDPGRANLRAMTGNRGADSVSVVRGRVVRQVPYPLDSLLRIADSVSLELTAAQRDSLSAEAKRYRIVADARVDDIVALLVSNGGRPDMGAIAPKLQQANLALVKAIQESIKMVERTLSPVQWAKVPDKIRFPFGQQQPGQ